MSLNLPLWRIPRSVTVLKPQRRTFLERFFGKRKPIDTNRAPKNPLTEEYLKKKPKQPELVRGDLAPSSLFEDEKLAGPKPKGSSSASPVTAEPMIRDYKKMAAALDPQPERRRRWERKLAIREIQKRGRLTKTQLLRKQERELLLRSHDFPTSVKKLVPLAKQITGKTVEEAITQMRFSVKKAAAEVKLHLEHAKNEAIVKRGMGLGSVTKEGGETKKFHPIVIQTKDKKRVKVTDPSTMYVAQAWVGRGPYKTTPDYRARGQIHMMKNPTTSLTLVLKEEKTRIRLHNERQEKIKSRKVWVQLPNRPITAQRQHYSW